MSLLLNILNITQLYRTCINTERFKSVVLLKTKGITTYIHIVRKLKKGTKGVSWTTDQTILLTVLDINKTSYLKT